jgi:hypothetical protein
MGFERASESGHCPPLSPICQIPAKVTEKLTQKVANLLKTLTLSFLLDEDYYGTSTNYPITSEG